MKSDYDHENSTEVNAKKAAILDLFFGSPIGTPDDTVFNEEIISDIAEHLPAPNEEGYYAINFGMILNGILQELSDPGSLYFVGNDCTITDHDVEEIKDEFIKRLHNLVAGAVGKKLIEYKLFPNGNLGFRYRRLT